MSIEDIVTLIKTCKNAGVSKLKFEKLELHFQHPPFEPTDANAKAVLPKEKSIETVIEEDPELRQILLENIMIEDPLVYENMRKGE